MNASVKLSQWDEDTRKQNELARKVGVRMTAQLEDELVVPFLTRPLGRSRRLRHWRQQQEMAVDDRRRHARELVAVVL